MYIIVTNVRKCNRSRVESIDSLRRCMQTSWKKVDFLQGFSSLETLDVLRVMEVKLSGSLFVRLRLCTSR